MPGKAAKITGAGKSVSGWALPGFKTNNYGGRKRGFLTTVEGALHTAVSELENKQIDKTKVRNAVEEIRSL